MKNITQHTGIIEHVEYFDTSTNGNSRYSFYIDGYKVFTGVDSIHGYKIRNYEGKKSVITCGTHRGKLTLNTIIKR